MSKQKVFSRSIRTGGRLILLCAATLAIGSMSVSGVALGDRDKNGTTGSRNERKSPQTLENKGSAGTVSQYAERGGLSTPCFRNL